MRKTKNVFVSFSFHDRGLAQKLIEELRARNISVLAATDNAEPDTDWQRRTEEVIRSADAVVVLLGPKHVPSKHQEAEWSTALELHWGDSNKQLVPVLLGNAELPSFLANRQALRIRDVKMDWDGALEDLIRILSNDSKPSSEFLSVEKEDPSKRLQRLRNIEEFAHSLKTR